MTVFIRFIILCILIFPLTKEFGRGGEQVQEQEITVVITDSGLGGLAVMDTISKELAARGIYEKADLIFVNALFNADKGYNALIDRQAKIDSFDTVLEGIEAKFDPDIIIIGCNTLSVLFPETVFAKDADTPVQGIVEPGVRLIYDQLIKSNNSKVIIAGTETTISEDSHRKSLLKKGISDERIITQACPELQSYIESDPYAEDTEMLISFYMSEAIAQLQEETGSVYLSLNCSHFGYSEKLWKKAFEDSGVGLEEILNPNHAIGKVLLPEQVNKMNTDTKISLAVYSKVLIRNKESMVGIFRERSPGLAEALSNYILDKDLF